MNKAYVLFFLLWSQWTVAQQSQSLPKLLEQLSKTYRVTFSYNPVEIRSGLELSSTSFLNLDEAIQYIKNNTNLTVEKVDSQNYIIFKQKKSVRYLCGKVLDKNQEPLSNVEVKKGALHTRTDFEGNFSLKVLDETAVIVVNPYDYNTKLIPVSEFKNTCKTIVLEAEVVALNEVVISNYLTKGLTKNENGSITIDIQNTGVLPGNVEPDAIQTLQFIPGLQSPDETVTGLHIRGSTPDQNLILYDGVKVYQDAHFFGLISAFNPYVINKINLFKSATKAKYGGHVGGVIEIEVDKSVPEKLSAGISTTLTHSSADIKIPIFKDIWAVFASARRGLTDVVNTITSENFSEVAFQNTSLINLFTTSSNHTLSDNHQFTYEDYYIKSVFQPYASLKFNLGFLNNQNNLSFEGINPTFRSETNDNLLVKSHTYYQNVSFNSSILGLHQLQFSTTYFSKTFKGLNGFNNNQEGPRLLEVTFGKTNMVEETSIHYEGEKKLFKNTFLQFGYQRNRSNVQYSADSFSVNRRAFQEFFRGKETSQSFHTDFKFRNKKLQLNVGGRRQFFNRLYKVFWEPRVLVNYKLFSNFRGKISYELKHQSISQTMDLRNDGLGSLFNRLWVASTDSNTPVIENNQISFGIDFQKRGWTIDIETYYKQLDGIGILLNDNIFSPRNVSGINHVKGIDVLLKKKWKHYETWFSYSFSESRYQFEAINNNELFKGSFDIPHNLVWSHTVNFNNLSFSLGYRYRTGLPYTQKSLNTESSQSNFIVFDVFNGERLPDYHRLDFTANYQFYLDKSKKIKSQIGLTFQNLTNKRNILSRNFRVIESNTDLGSVRPLLRQIDRLSTPFTPNILIRLSL